MKFFEAVDKVVDGNGGQQPAVILAAAIIYAGDAIAQAIYSLSDGNENSARLISDSLDRMAEK